MNWQDFIASRPKTARPFIMAHRGASAVLPENTLPAFERAIADGADILETDLRFTKDGEIVLIHDETVDRTTDGRGYVGHYTLRELKRLKIKGPLSGTNRRETAPTLPELIETTGAQVPLALELKDPRFAEPGHAKKLVRILDEAGLLEQCVIISFDMERLQTMKAQAPAMAIGWITFLNPSPNHPVDFLGPFWPLLFFNPLYVPWARKLGKTICPLDPVPESRLGIYLRLGFDVVMTNDPAVTLQALTKKGRSRNPALE